ncbi:MAG: type II toxin-antitoxin system HicB family antitoxin [Dehalococcoidia bacterium]|nr:type II toxin-antitoxin system HicB family antitoxin [Dehalococcoidia bacterium]
MLTDYVRIAMRHARYELLPEEGTYYGNIPDFQGVWATASTLESCRDELQEVLEDWIVLALRQGHRLPAFDGVDLNVRDVA